MLRRVFHDHIRQGFLELGRYAHEKIVPKHFTRAATGEYDYQRREAITGILKQKRGQENVPAKKTGETKHALQRMYRLMPTSRGLTLRMRGPRYLGYQKQKKKGGMSPNLPQELSRLSEKDAQELSERFAASMDRHFQRNTETETT